MIKMLTSTHYDGKRYQHGEMYTVDAKIEKRWVKNGIAEAVGKAAQPPPLSPIPEPDPPATAEQERRPGRPKKQAEQEDGGS